MAYSRRLVPVAVALLALTACGGGKKAATPTFDPSLTAPPPFTDTPSATGSAPARTTAPPSGGTTTSAPAGSNPGTHPPSSGTVTPSGSATTPPPEPIHVVLTLARACVTPGGTQRADVTTLPGALVVVDTRYSDNKDGQTHGGLKADGRADETGHFSFAWTVLPGTPTGEATTFVGTTQGARGGSAQKKFRVATTC